MQSQNNFIRTIELKSYLFDELPAEWQEVCQKAKESAFQAYAIYSNFRVGAAVLLENNTILSANNQENAAYPSGLCAERTLLFYTHANYPELKIKAIAIYSPDTTSLLTPCGGCRQVLLEYEHLQKENIATLIQKDEHVFVLDSAKDWLPFEFSDNTLK